MENKAVIVYKSCTGFTKKYAELIAKETGSALEELQKASAESLSPYQTVVFGGRLHAGHIDGWQRAKAMAQKGGARQIILFAVGAMPNTAEGTIAEMWKNNLSAEKICWQWCWRLYCAVCLPFLFRGICAICLKILQFSKFLQQ